MLHRGSNSSLARAMDGCVMRRGIIVSCQSAATSKTVKALLVTSLTHVSSALASTGLLAMLLLCRRVENGMEYLPLQSTSGSGQTILARKRFGV